MTAAAQRRLAVLAALLAAAAFVAANLHLWTVAVGSQPDCVAQEAMAPAQRAC